MSLTVEQKKDISDRPNEPASILAQEYGVDPQRIYSYRTYLKRKNKENKVKSVSKKETPVVFTEIPLVQKPVDNKVIVVITSSSQLRATVQELLR